MNYKDLKPHLEHSLIPVDDAGYIKFHCSCGETLLYSVPKYRGALVSCLDKDGEMWSDIYISFGFPVPSCGRDSFGIPDSGIFDYIGYGSFLALAAGSRTLDEYHTIFRFTLVENDAYLEDYL
jgi:hypothetical protein